MAADAREHADRIARLESMAQNAPTHNDLSKVYERLNRVAESVSRIEGTLVSFGDTQRLILNRIAQKGMP